MLMKKRIIEYKCNNRNTTGDSKVSENGRDYCRCFVSNTR